MENDQIENNQKSDYNVNKLNEFNRLNQQFNCVTNQEQSDQQINHQFSNVKSIGSDQIMNDLNDKEMNDLNDDQTEDKCDNHSEDKCDNQSGDKCDNQSEDKCDNQSDIDDKSSISSIKSEITNRIKTEDDSSMNCTDYKRLDDQQTDAKLSPDLSDKIDLNDSKESNDKIDSNHSKESNDKKNLNDIKNSNEIRDSNDKKDLNIDQINKLDHDIENNEMEGSGFPKCFDGWVIRGKAIMINKRTLNDLEIDGNDAILDCVSQVAPILLKKPNIFPSRYESHFQGKSIETEAKELDKKATNEKDQDEKEEKSDLKEEKSDLKEEKSDLKEQSSIKLKDAKVNEQTMLMIPDYFNSSVGDFLMRIGLSRCKEALHKDAMKQTQRSIRKEGERAEYLDELDKQTQLFNECKGANSIFNFEQIRCNQCDFKTESQTVMEGHYLVPHLSNRKEYRCNYCTFITRDQRTIIYHFNVEHKKYCLPEFPPVLYECPTCNYESNQKSKAANHMAKCVKAFTDDVQAELTNLKTDVKEDEYPAVTPRPISQDDLKLYDSTMQAIKPVAINPNMQLPIVPGLPRALQKQMLILLQAQFSQQKLKLNKAMATKLTNQHNNNLRQQLQQQNNLMSSLLLNNVNPTALAATLNGSSLLNNLNNLSNLGNLNNLNNLNSFAKTAPQLYNMLQSGSQLNSNKNRLSVNSNQLAPQKPNIKGLLQSNSNNNRATSSNDSTVPGKAGTFVICEICDGYIKDLEQLRAHMQWVHKVKIHPKMLASRPPLNCQKCQWRFFTDQGLERHLLGAHGLVTSNMQDLVDHDQDGGRCTICGKVFGNKLVAHMSQVHKITLRPAHLSYKCTVCSATFNLYRLFENHVYMVHSAQKRSNDSETNSVNKKQKTIDLRMNGV